MMKLRFCQKYGYHISYAKGPGLRKQEDRLILFLIFKKAIVESLQN